MVGGSTSLPTDFGRFRADTEDRTVYANPSSSEKKTFRITIWFGFALDTCDETTPGSLTEAAKLVSIIASILARSFMSDGFVMQFTV